MRGLVARVVVSAVVLGTMAVSAQELQEFPKGVPGEVYFAPRIDLVPADQGGPLDIELDGFFDEPFWDKADWQGMTEHLTPAGDPDDAELMFAAASDGEFLYVGWRFIDDVLVIGESTFCDVWMDDSVEFYIDGNNDGPDCTDGAASCYEEDDAQITVGADQWEKEDPEELEFGGLAGAGGACDFFAPHPEVASGVVSLINEDPEDYVGWQGEVAIALETLGNNDDGSPAWVIDAEHQNAIGFSVQYNDDDDGGERDHKATWSAIEATESAWRNPGAFGKLIFIDPTKDTESCLLEVGGLACATRAEDGSVEITWVNPEDSDPAVPTKILVDDQEVGEAPGDAESVTLTSDQVPLDNQDHVVTVTNCSGRPASCTVLGGQFDDCGGIRLWNILGAFLQGGDCCPDVDTIRADYMTDGEIADVDFEWRPGAEIETDLAIAASNGIDGGAADRAPGGVPTVFSRFSRDGRVDLNREFGGQIEQVMAYAQVYVTVDEPLEVYLGLSSDDSIQVLVDGEEQWINSVGRGGAGSCSPQDQPDVPVFLDEGTHSLMLKVFNGVSGWDFTVRFQEEPPVFGTAQPITEGITLSLTPPEVGPEGALLKPDDVNGDAAVNISDPVALLGFLFASGPLPPCLTVPDSDPVALNGTGTAVLDHNGDGNVDIADAVGALSNLFGGGGPPALGQGCVRIEGPCTDNCQ